MRQTTLCFLRDKDRLLLAMKKRGFGEGKWNGVGGKVEPGESLEAAAVREAAEEIAVEIQEGKLQKAGKIRFYFDEKPDWDQECSIFFADEWVGEPQESDEMRPVWYALEDIPFDTMWIDDPIWLPRVLAGQTIEADFYFTNGGKEIIRYSVNELG
jgi:8-oxo-dGTP pyrophosphatase MutT (NUDIX family)